MKNVVGLFDTLTEAEAVVRELRAAGIAQADISLVSGGSETATDALHAFNAASGETGNEAREGAAFGAAGGAFVGGLTGMVIGLGLVSLPGVGPVLAAGSLAAALGSTVVGAGVGAAAGGLLGALVGAGIPKHEAEIYTESIRRGGTLVLATVDDAHAERVREIMNQHNVVDIEERGRQYRAQGWPAAAEPGVAEHGTIEAERLRATGADHDPAAAARSVADGLVAPVPSASAPGATDEHRPADYQPTEQPDRRRAEHDVPAAASEWERSSKTGTVAGAMTGAAAGGVAGIAGGPVGAASGMAAGAATGAALGAAADASGEKAAEEQGSDQPAPPEH
ncbi:hypothetical protein [Kallotenue papyrolyticum]|uniref:hypothetical protein n=1 Tax=Kallotenue papyrolyticum TaxID=1325125 RepID=UPI000492CDB1|nr:hypothetical protein [Kallotenue papyrolyticum]